MFVPIYTILTAVLLTAAAVAGNIYLFPHENSEAVVAAAAAAAATHVPHAWFPTLPYTGMFAFLTTSAVEVPPSPALFVLWLAIDTLFPEGSFARELWWLVVPAAIVLLISMLSVLSSIPLIRTLVYHLAALRRVLVPSLLGLLAAAAGERAFVNLPANYFAGKVKEKVNMEVCELSFNLFPLQVDGHILFCIHTCCMCRNNTKGST